MALFRPPLDMHKLGTVCANLHMSQVLDRDCFVLGGVHLLPFFLGGGLD